MPRSSTRKRRSTPKPIPRQHRLPDRPRHRRCGFRRRKGTTVAVEWADRGGAAQRIVLDSVIARSDPIWSGALAVGAGAGVPRGSLGRSPFVPVTARSLGGGRSALKPTTSGSTAIVFDDRSGEIVARCNGIAARPRPAISRRATSPDMQRRPLAAAGRHDPLHRGGAAAGRDGAGVPPALTMTLALGGGSYAAAPECSVEAMKTVRYPAGGGLRIEAVPLDAMPASLGLDSWLDSGDRHLAYRCIVTPRADGRWSGRSALQPSGWTIGTGSGDRRGAATNRHRRLRRDRCEHRASAGLCRRRQLAPGAEFPGRGWRPGLPGRERRRLPFRRPRHASSTNPDPPDARLERLAAHARRPEHFADAMREALTLAEQAVGLSDPEPARRLRHRRTRRPGDRPRPHPGTGEPHAEVMALREAARERAESRRHRLRHAWSPALTTAARRRAPIRSSPPASSGSWRCAIRIRWSLAGASHGCRCRYRRALRVDGPGGGRANVGFVCRMARGRPWVRVKAASPRRSVGARPMVAASGSPAKGPRRRPRLARPGRRHAHRHRHGQGRQPGARRAARADRAPAVRVYRRFAPADPAGRASCRRRGDRLYAADRTRARAARAGGRGDLVALLPMPMRQGRPGGVLADLARRGINEIHVEAG